MDTITINAVPAAAFAFAPTSLCEDTVNFPLPAAPVGVAFSYSIWSGGMQYPSGISGNNVVPSALPPDSTYEIRNIATEGVCSDTAYDYFSTIHRDSANIQFIPSIICIGDNDPYPFILGDGGGTFSSMIQGDTVDTIRGIVQIDNSLRTYIVRYTTGGACKSADIDSVSVANRIPTAFDYGQLSFCVTDSMNDTLPNPHAQLVNLAGSGRFSYIVEPPGNPNLILALNDSTGHIILSQSDAGIYDVTFRITHSPRRCVPPHVRQ